MAIETRKGPKGDYQFDTELQAPVVTQTGADGKQEAIGSEHVVTADEVQRKEIEEEDIARRKAEKRAEKEKAKTDADTNT